MASRAELENNWKCHKSCKSWTTCIHLRREFRGKTSRFRRQPAVDGTSGGIKSYRPSVSTIISGFDKTFLTKMLKLSVGLFGPPSHESSQAYMGHNAIVCRTRTMSAVVHFCCISERQSRTVRESVLAPASPNTMPFLGYTQKFPFFMCP